MSNLSDDEIRDQADILTLSEKIIALCESGETAGRLDIQIEAIESALGILVARLDSHVEDMLEEHG